MTNLDPLPTTEAAIVLIRHRDQILIRQRPDRPGSPMPGYWEFPGGKREPGERIEQTAIREVREETGLDVILNRLRLHKIHQYPHGLVHLSYFEAELVQTLTQPIPSGDFRWVPIKSLDQYEFPPANDTIIAQLMDEV